MSNVLPLYRVSTIEPPEPPYPTSSRRSIILGWIVIAILFGGLGTWAAVVPLSSAAIAPGTVVVDSNRKSLQHLEGGVIREILVRDGDLVEAGQVLLRLDGANVRAAIASLQPMLATNQAIKARLLAERFGLEEIVFPDELVLEAAENDATAQILVGQQRIFETRGNTLAGERALNANRLAQSRQRLDGLERQVQAKQRELSLMQKELDDQLHLLGKGYTTKRRAVSAERIVQQIQNDIADLHSRLEESRLLVARYELEEIQISKNYIEQVENEIHEVNQQSYQILERMRAMQDQYTRLDLRAPVPGLVVNMVAHTIGGVVSPGSQILDIVPKNDKLMVEAQVPPNDIDGVRAGLSADVGFPAFRSAELPRLRGTVTMVSADRLTRASGAPYFLVRIEVSEDELKRLASLTLIPGMPAEVLVKKSDRTLLNYLLSPVIHGIWTAFRE